MALIVGSGITIGSGISIQPTDFDYERTGLLLHLDAGIPASYPGSGSTWTDLVASKTFTLYNSPTYSSTKGGYLNFNSASSSMHNLLAVWALILQLGLLKLGFHMLLLLVLIQLL
jgi:hypothetical protein